MSIDVAQFDHSLRATALVGTYVPRACGIATFTRDLREALVFDAAAAPSAGPGPPWVVALDHGRGRDPVAYPPEVRHRLRRGDRGSVNRIATALEADGVRVVSLQHEFGIYGGHSGRDVLALADALRAPLVTTFHTVLARPQPLQREIVRRLAAASARVVVMTERGRALLQSAHGVPAERITVIPHGVPDMPFADPDVAKPRLGVGGRRVILSFGLINPNKALELAIDALARVVGEVPEACYIICGATHPEVRRRHGEAYRHSLVERIEHLGLEKHVRFVDRYLDQRELTAWLQAADVFVTPYANAAQITSGTLAYAVAAGKAVVSTPYEHARELLADGRGAVVPFGDVEALAARFRELLTDDAARDAMRRLAWLHGRASIWPAVGQRYRELFVEVIAERRAAERAAAPPMAAVAVAPRSPDGRRPLPLLPFPAPLAGVSRRHLDRMWDEWGLFQHAIGAHPDPRHGFCTDDVARAVVVDLLQSLATSWPAPAASLRRGVAFLEAAFHPGEGRFRNFRGADGRWLEAVGSEDSHGRALQALGAVIRGSRDPILHARVRRLFTVALPAALSFRSLRPWAYAVLGCDATLAAGASAGIPDATAAPATRLTLATLAGRLAVAVASAPERHGWPWPEHAVTYDNGVVPQALIAAGLRLERDDWVRLGLDRLAWLAAAQTAPDGHLTLIGNDGWWPRGDRPARFDQQPIEAVSLLEAARMALAGTGEPHWALLMERAYSWFLGANDLGLPLADPDHGSCRDGLRPDSINPNRGAESTLAWLLAVERIRGLRSPVGLPVGLLIGTPRSEVALSGSG